jgi:predicted enzyme related to lactoylglutathione lyase
VSETTKNNPVNYFEIGTPDPAAARAFYGAVFGWQFGEGSYSQVNGNGGGLWDTSEIGAETWAVFYIEVADVAASIENAVAAGARVVRAPVDTGVIRFAHLADPAGNRFGVWERAESEPSNV